MTDISVDALKFIFGRETTSLSDLSLKDKVELLTTASQILPIAGYICTLQSLRQAVLERDHKRDGVTRQDVSSVLMGTPYMEKVKFLSLGTITDLGLDALLADDRSSVEGTEEVAALKRTDAVTRMELRLIRIHWRLEKKYDDSRTVPQADHFIKAVRVNDEPTSFEKLLTQMDESTTKLFIHRTLWRLYEIMSGTKSHFEQQGRVYADSERRLGAVLNRLGLL